MIGPCSSSPSPAAAGGALKRDVVKKRCQLAGLEAEFSAHSLRSGFVTEAGRRGVPLGETMAMTGHRSTASLVGYPWQGQMAQSHAVRLLDENPDDT